ncbi:hypothetical protein T07_4519 [Trichinella nelsoni]|uniref:Uncharacterized protein n=1 Tax=Trichinella nelsoni TaxID=6336 RepID=A0A0V0SAA1_9BILA|nr:hypothetical protein T07_4519 [Trichinella nelsoni]
MNTSRVVLFPQVVSVIGFFFWPFVERTMPPPLVYRKEKVTIFESSWEEETMVIIFIVYYAFFGNVPTSYCYYPLFGVADATSRHMDNMTFAQLPVAASHADWLT